MLKIKPQASLRGWIWLRCPPRGYMTAWHVDWHSQQAWSLSRGREALPHRNWGCPLQENCKCTLTANKTNLREVFYWFQNTFRVFLIPGSLGVCKVLFFLGCAPTKLISSSCTNELFLLDFSQHRGWRHLLIRFYSLSLQCMSYLQSDLFTSICSQGNTDRRKLNERNHLNKKC